MDPEPAPIPNWNEDAERILCFIRKQQLVVALDEGVWVYSGSAESQLAAFIRDQNDRKNLKKRKA